MGSGWLRPSTLCTAIMAFPSACSNAPNDVSAETSGVTVRDSAGVEIVVNSGNTIPEDRAWRLAGEPSLTIGVAEGDEAHQLYRVRGALRLPSGGIVILNDGSRELRFFDESGSFSKSIGTNGEGPGEFTAPEAIGWFTPDTIGVWDRSLRRVSLIGPDGEFRRAFTVPAHAGEDPLPTQLQAFRRNGSLVFRGLDADFIRSEEVGLREDRPPHFLFRESAGELRPLGRFLSGQALSWVEDGELLTGTPEFNRAPDLVAGPGFLAHGTGLVHGFEMYDERGQLTRIVRGTEPLRPITRALLDRHLDERVRGVDDPAQRAANRAAIAGKPFPDSVPGFRRILVEPEEETVWLQDYPMAWDTTWRWTVFSPDGRQLTRLETPVIPGILEIGPSHLLVLDRDDLGVERVLMYPIIKPE